MSGTEDNEAYLRYLKEHDKTTLGDLELQDKRAAIAIEKLSTLVDRETWKNAVVQHNLVVLRIATRYPRDVKALPLSLRNRTFTELLDLSEDQLAKLEKIENDLREKWETWREERAQQINDLRNKKYREILAVLSKEQQKTYQEVYGDPIDFDRLASGSFSVLDEARNWLRPNSYSTRQGIYVLNPHLRPSVPSGLAAGNLGLGKAKPAPAVPLAVHPDKLPEKLDLLFVEMLRNRATQREFEPTPQQAKKLDRLVNQIDAYTTQTNKFNQQRLEQLLKGEYDDYGLLESILLEKQIEWLRAAELQIRLMAYHESFGLLSPELSKVLELDGNTKRRIREIVKRYQKEDPLEAISQEWLEKYNALLSDYVIDTIDVLTPEQKNLLGQYLPIPRLAELLKQQAKERDADRKKTLLSSGNLGPSGDTPNQ